MNGTASHRTLEDLRRAYPGAITGEFGDTPALSRHLIALIREGRKTATCGALADYKREGDPVPGVGDFEIALDETGAPALVLQITDVALTRFEDVTWDFARDEGEDDDLQGWRDGHSAFFERTCGFDPAMVLVCLRFRLAEDLATGGLPR